MASDWLPFGILRRPHGTQGEILLHPWNDGAPGARAAVPACVRLTRGRVVREIETTAARPVREGYLVRFAGVADRESAAALVGMEVEVRRRSLAPLAAREFYVEDVVGCQVADAAGRPYGQVRGTFWNGAQDIMVVVAEDGSERLIPVVAEYLLAFDAESRRLVVDLHD
jgi:16S rRNA processing protein RimM